MGGTCLEDEIVHIDGAESGLIPIPANGDIHFAGLDVVPYNVVVMELEPLGVQTVYVLEGPVLIKATS
jgi:hypothetical protein